MRIPDITERFPEGYDGVDMTNGLARGYGEIEESYNDGIEIPYENGKPEPRVFVKNRDYIFYGPYGGVTLYRVKKFDRANNRILFSQKWRDLDGSGTRPAEWLTLSKDSDGNERCLVFESTNLGCAFYIEA